MAEIGHLENRKIAISRRTRT